MTPRCRVLCYIGALDAGGAERQVVEILKHLDRTRFEPKLLLAHRQGVLLSEVPGDVPVLACTPDGELPVGRFSRWRRIRRFAQILHEQQIDVVYDRTYLATLDAALACRWRRTPRLSAAVADPAVQFAMYARRPRWLWRRYSRWAYRSANRVLANSAGLQRQLIDFWQLPAEQVVLQPNALDFDRIDRLLSDFSSGEGEAPAEPRTITDHRSLSGSAGAAPSPVPQAADMPSLRRRDDRFRLLTVGRIDDDKGHADLLDAITELVQRRGITDLAWHILGTGPSEAALKTLIVERGLQSVVQFLGVQTNPFPFYRAADLFVLPSRTEGLPNVLLEALACGTPVISTDCPSGPREILHDGQFGTLVPVRQPTALADAIVACRANLSARREQAARGQHAVREQYAARTVVQRLEELLLRAAFPNRRAGGRQSPR